MLLLLALEQQEQPARVSQPQLLCLGEYGTTTSPGQRAAAEPPPPHSDCPI